MNQDKRVKTRNAADEKQVRKAQTEQELERRGELNDLRVLLDIPEGRRFLWRVLGKCRVFESIWESSARIHFNSGQQDLGHWCMAEIAEANVEGLFQMMRESADQESKPKTKSTNQGD